MIEIKHLRTVRALFDTGSVQAAANMLCVTQSALSHQLKELEHRVGSVLFERKTQPVQFSHAGELLLKLARKVLPAVDEVTEQLKAGNDDTQALQLCVECHACFHWLLPAVRHFNAQPNLPAVEFVPFIEHNAIEALLHQQLDVVLTTDIRMTEQVSFHHLFDMELRLLLSPDHALANCTYIKPAQLISETLLSYPVPVARQDVFRHFLAETDFKGKVKPVAQGSQILQLVAAGQGIAVMPSWMAQPYQQQGLICSIALGPEGLRRPMYLACRQAQLSSSIKALTLSIRQFSPVG
ncbi:LysR substrate-binding domain-containing protein [Rheinheimera baltica]|uniref:LysR substrate-binding domain-containing protein n=2 Tax=Rheinheimera baltica TaxID=67576 RepID=UPI000422C361|nr:LysR substrate-binding domain-containing protein [Rheinheimera baltica]MDP5143224.1 LysR substrate-binding domain-containing protein [Rheinheimera baltica]MDP5149963.1 LysR substrate-binding domain-containing protein [Rheinheimera baltica]